jgi:hypothetical protein
VLIDVLIDMLIDIGMLVGLSEGFSEGLSEDFSEGLSEGFSEGLSEGLSLLPALPIGLLLPAFPMRAILAPFIPPKENERERSADIDASSTRARTWLPSLRLRKITWAPTVSIAIAAKRKKLDTRMVVWMILLLRWESNIICLYRI